MRSKGIPYPFSSINNWVTGEGIPERRWLDKVKDDNNYDYQIE